jgi:hypothetical protein
MRYPHEAYSASRYTACDWADTNGDGARVLADRACRICRDVLLLPTHLSRENRKH